MPCPVVLVVPVDVVALLVVRVVDPCDVSWVDGACDPDVVVAGAVCVFGAGELPCVVDPCVVGALTVVTCVGAGACPC